MAASRSELPLDSAIRTLVTLPLSSTSTLILRRLPLLAVEHSGYWFATFAAP